MNPDIYVESKDVWDFYKKNIKRMSEELVLIAENKETEYAVYVTQDEGYLTILVYKDEEEILDDFALEKFICEVTIEGIYEKYLYPGIYTDNGYQFVNEEDCAKAHADAPPLPSSTQDMEDTVYEREDELYMATLDLLEKFTYRAIYAKDYIDDCADEEMYPVEVDEIYAEVIADSLVNVFCKYLKDEHYVSVYRPMFIQTDKGEEIFTEYPYDHPEFVKNQDAKQNKK